MYSNQLAELLRSLSRGRSLTVNAVCQHLIAHSDSLYASKIPRSVDHICDHLYDLVALKSDRMHGLNLLQVFRSLLEQVGFLHRSPLQGSAILRLRTIRCGSELELVTPLVLVAIDETSRQYSIVDSG